REDVARACVRARWARRAASPAAARVADHDPAQVREARLPVRGRRAAREPGGFGGPCRARGDSEPASCRGARGAGGAGPLPGGPGGAGRAGARGGGGAAGQVPPAAGWLGGLKLTGGAFTAPGSRLFCGLMTGWVLTPGRHTITRVLTLADPDGRRARDSYHRFRAGRRATGRLWQVHTVHAVALTCSDGVAGLLVDDALAHQSGQTTEGAGTFRDAVRSTVKKVARARGLNVVVICLRVDPPRGGTPIALPLSLRIRARKSGKKTTGPAAEMTREIAVWLPGRRLHLTGDGACACLAWHKTTIDIRGRKAGRLVAVFDLLWYQVRKDKPAPARLVGRGGNPGSGRPEGFRGVIRRPVGW